MKSTLQVDGGLHISVPLCGYDDGSIWINNHFDDIQQGKLGKSDSTHGLFYPSLPPCTNLFSSLSITIKNFPLNKLVVVAMPCVMMSKFFQCSSSSNLRFLHYKVIDLLIIERISIKFKPISDDPCCQYR